MDMATMNNLTDQIPHTILLVPIFDRLYTDDSSVVGIISTVYAWDSFLRYTLPEGASGIHAELHNSCGQRYTFLINGPDVTFLGQGMLHDTRYSKYEFEIRVYDFMGRSKETISEADCLYTYRLYPTDSFQAIFKTDVPIIVTVIVAMSFVVMATTFFVYDWFVVRKNEKIISAAAHSSAIVSVSLS
jgi:hypothetical protein